MQGRVLLMITGGIAAYKACFLARLLQQAGFSILTAGDGQEAVEVFARNASRISVVLLDLAMPRMDGREALGAIRKIRADVPIFLGAEGPKNVAASVRKRRARRMAISE